MNVFGRALGHLNQSFMVFTVVVAFLKVVLLFCSMGLIVVVFVFFFFFNDFSLGFQGLLLLGLGLVLFQRP